MEIAEKLQLLAGDRAELARRRESELEWQLNQLEFQKTRLIAQINSARRVSDRLGTYETTIDGNYQCPKCWIDRGEKAVLKPISSASDIDLFRCSQCGQQIDHTAP
jgi:hypothetical protein